MGYKAKVSWDELKTEGVLKGLYVPKSIKCVSLKEAFTLASELKKENAQSIKIERYKNAV
jgi:hypothetical protein